jgi:hypothetical protein
MNIVVYTGSNLLFPFILFKHSLLNVMNVSTKTELSVFCDILFNTSIFIFYYFRRLRNIAKSDY